MSTRSTVLTDGTRDLQERPPGLGPVIPYFVLTWLLSAMWLVPLAIAGRVVYPGRGSPTHFPALLGPALAAVIVSAAVGGRAALTGLGRAVAKVRVPLRWWLVALSPLLIGAGTLVLATLTGRPLPAAADFAVYPGLPAAWGPLGVALTVVVVNGIGEETGWRGYALPALERRFTPLTATVVLTLGWGVWHLPMFLVLSSYRGFTAATTVFWCFGLLCGGLVFTWLHDRSGGSVALVAIWHGTYNLTTATRAAEGLLQAATTTVVLVAAVTLVVLELRARRRGGRSVLSGSELPPGQS